VTVNEGGLRKKNEVGLAFSSLAMQHPGRFEGWRTSGRSAMRCFYFRFFDGAIDAASPEPGSSPLGAGGTRTVRRQKIYRNLNRIDMSRAKEPTQYNSAKTQALAKTDHRAGLR
jgi:hypothetical protein